MTTVDTILSPQRETPVPQQRYFSGVSDILMRCALTVIIFFGVGLGLLFLMDFIYRAHRLYDTRLFLLCLSAGITFFLSRSTWRMHVISEQKGRRFSMLIGAYWGYFLTLIYVMIFPYKITYCIGLMVILPLVGIYVGTKFPMYGIPTLWKRLLCGLGLWCLAFPLLWIISMISMAFFFTSSLSYQGERLPSGLSTFFCHDYALITHGKIPCNATDIYIKGKGGRVYNVYHWSCRISEEDFLTFAKENNYHLFGNDDKRDVQWMRSRLDTLQGPFPDRYWGAYDYDNDITFLYDCTTGIFHGHNENRLSFFLYYSSINV